MWIHTVKARPYVFIVLLNGESVLFFHMNFHKSSYFLIWTFTKVRTFSYELSQKFVIFHMNFHKSSYFFIWTFTVKARPYVHIVLLNGESVSPQRNSILYSMVDLVDEIVCPNRTLTHPGIKLTWEQKHIQDYADTVDTCLVWIMEEWTMVLCCLKIKKLSVLDGVFMSYWNYSY